MLKISDLVGLPVLEQSSCEQIGEVQEVLINIRQALVQAAIVTSFGWFTDKQVLPLKHIVAVSNTDVLITNKSELQTLATGGERFADLIERPLITEAGVKIGVLADLWFELTTGIIEAYVVSDGVVTDLLEGRRKLPYKISRAFNSDRIIVADYAAELL
jgi:uncharacterized protein YrrD